MPGDYVVGMDVGTSGVRAVAVDARGEMLASAEEPLAAPRAPQPGWSEQDAEAWSRALAAAARRCLEALPHRARAPAAVCVDSTSGTVVAADAGGRALRPAVMYNDTRAAAEADELNDVGAELTRRLGYRFNASYGLPKALWLLRHEGSRCAGARFMSPADFLTLGLCGACVSEETNALKMGYDLIERRWPEWLKDVGLSPERLPRVGRSGEIVGAVTPLAAKATGLPAGTPVAAGPTDGVAGFYASGAATPGEAATTLGTTLVVKSVSRDLVRDPLGRLYCHRHAEGHWLPGGASNCGGEYAATHFAGAELSALDDRAGRLLPVAKLCYPLARRGERFPAVCADAERFITATPQSVAEHFAMYLQGVAFVERWAYETIRDLGGSSCGTVFTSGGGSHSDVWMQLRADVLGCAVVRTGAPHSAFGSAVLAASRTLHAGVSEAARAMVRVERRFEPRPDRARRCDELYAAFRRECRDRGMP